jgi:hypothetical protein
MIPEALFHAESGDFTMACCVDVRRKSCETVGELRISMISFAAACRLALRSERWPLPAERDCRRKLPEKKEDGDG